MIAKIDVGIEWTDMNGQTWVVAPACANAGGGRWICTTHPEEGAFRNNFEKDLHVSDDSVDHVLAWVCVEHGVEQP